MKNNYLILSGVLVVIVLGLIILNTTLVTDPIPEYTHSFEQANTLFGSFDGETIPLMQALAQNDDFLLVIETKEQSLTGDIMGRTLVLATVVLIGNGKDVVTVSKIFNAEGVFESCVTNYGDNKTSDSISLETCRTLLSDTENTTVFSVEIPRTRSIAVVEVANNTITLKPKERAEVLNLTFLVLETLYPNAQDIIDQVNNTATAQGLQTP